MTGSLDVVIVIMAGCVTTWLLGSFFGLRLMKNAVERSTGKKVNWCGEIEEVSK